MRERDGESTWQKEFSSWYWNNGGKKRKVDRLKAERAKEIKLTFVHSFSGHAKTLNRRREDKTGNKLM